MEYHEYDKFATSARHFAKLVNNGKIKDGQILYVSEKELEKLRNQATTNGNCEHCPFYDCCGDDYIPCD